MSSIRFEFRGVTFRLFNDEAKDQFLAGRDGAARAHLVAGGGGWIFRDSGGLRDNAGGFSGPSAAVAEDLLAEHTERVESPSLTSSQRARG